MLFAEHIISYYPYPEFNTISLEDGRSPLRHRWAAGTNLTPDAKRTFGTTSKQRWNDQAGARP
jgi:hypothetical protein